MESFLLSLSSISSAMDALPACSSSPAGIKMIKKKQTEGRSAQGMYDINSADLSFDYLSVDQFSAQSHWQFPNAAYTSPKYVKKSPIQDRL